MTKKVVLQDLKDFLETKPKINDLVNFHTSYKYFIYSKSQEFYKTLGKIVANQEKTEFIKILQEYEQCFLKALEIKEDRNKTYNVLLHILGYFKKYMTKEEKIFLLNLFEEYKNEQIELVELIKSINVYTNMYKIEYLKRQKFLNEDFYEADTLV